MKKSREKIISIIIKLIAICSSVYGLFRVIESLDSFTYFTVLSNIVIVIVLGVFLLIDIKCLINNK